MNAKESDTHETFPSADLNNVSHVIIDEAHERDVNIDLLLLLMKDLLQRNEHIRIVIMSATINPELFQHYFNNCPLISVPGITHRVDTFYIEVSVSRVNGSIFGGL